MVPCFQIISKRYEQGSLIITTNRAFKKRSEIFNNDRTLTSALLDRLLHHAEVVAIEDQSFRMKEKMVGMPSAARRFPLPAGRLPLNKGLHFLTGVFLHFYAAHGTYPDIPLVGMDALETFLAENESLTARFYERRLDTL